MRRLKKLNREVRELYNRIFPWPISRKEQNVSEAVISGFYKLYSEANECVSASMMIVFHKFSRIKSESTKLNKCKQFILGNTVRLPKPDFDINIRDIYNDFVPGKKINLNLKHEQ